MGEPTHTLPLQLAEAIPQVSADIVSIVEDDDYYSPRYLEVMTKAIGDCHLVAAQSRARVNLRAGHVDQVNVGTPLAGMMVKTETLAGFADRIAKLQRPRVDKLLRRDRTLNIMQLGTSDNPLLVSMCGLPGRTGFMRSHRLPRRPKRQAAALARLAAWIGQEDANLYRRVAGIKPPAQYPHQS